MNELFDLVREALMLAVTLVLPLALAALAGAVVGGLVVVLLGLQDQSIVSLVRAVSVVVTLLLVGGALRNEVVGFTADQWSTLAARGQTTPSVERIGAGVSP
jgi:type III secretory pathway component EscS